MGDFYSYHAQTILREADFLKPQLVLDKLSQKQESYRNSMSCFLAPKITPPLLRGGGRTQVGGAMAPTKDSKGGAAGHFKPIYDC